MNEAETIAQLYEIPENVKENISEILDKHPEIGRSIWRMGREELESLSNIFEHYRDSAKELNAVLDAIRLIKERKKNRSVADVMKLYIENFDRIKQICQTYDQETAKQVLINSGEMAYYTGLEPVEIFLEKIIEYNLPANKVREISRNAGRIATNTGLYSHDPQKIVKMINYLFSQYK